MSIGHIAMVGLLSVGVGISLVCSVGVLVMPGVYAKLHYLGPVGGLGAVLIAGAVVVQDGFTQASVKAVMLAIVLLISGPAISQATARAAKIRDEAGWDEEGGEDGV